MADQPTRRSRTQADPTTDVQEPTPAADAPEDADAKPRRRAARSTAAKPTSASRRSRSKEAAADAAEAPAPEAAPEGKPARKRTPRRARTNGQAEPELVASSDAVPADTAEESDRTEDAADDTNADKDRGRDRDDRSRDDRSRDDRSRDDRSRDDNRNDGRDGGQSRRRKRDRRKKDRGNRSDDRNDNGGGHPGEPFEGMLELIGDKKFGFIRQITTSLQKGDNDPFMPPPLIQKHNLRDGVALKGIIKPGRKGAWQVTRVDEVMGMDPDEWKETADFDEGLVIYPDEKLNLVTDPSDFSMRIVDLVAPLGKGQRALIVAPPRAGKTVMLKQMAAGIAKNHPEVKLVALLIDERPEEVTDFRRNTDAMVFASSNDYGEDNHIRVATLAFEYARRLVEQGHDVVMLLDSLTRLGRTFNLWGGNSGRTMSGGLDARALVMPRKIFGAARNIEHGGSLTIIATALVETGSRMDDVIFEEFKGTGNAEIVLDRELADKRIYPAINIRKSGTRNEERLMSEEQMRQRTMLFRVLSERHPVEAMQALLKQVQRSPSNVHLLNELIPEQTY